MLTSFFNLTAWQSKGAKGSHAVNAIEGLGWKFDHSNPNKEEQIKAWQAKSHTNVLAKKSIEAFGDGIGWQYDPTNPLNKEEQKKAWMAQSQTNVLAKKSVEAFGDGIGWKYDPTNPLNKEEQKKAWQEQSQRNVLANKACTAFGMQRKLSVTSVASSWVDLCRQKLQIVKTFCFPGLGLHSAGQYRL